ncbi:bacteriocin fulvocin C-related protein [Streptantibioticus rubrisoli]|uniref:Bacteriocin fulvocin C-related protein n=1 Tax=Streptantibioticus rubrisoli TaxID=1387313 RepID=A0ABT1PBP7_9ACTN|nr:bacteriocin fulvocin C-related protein [Streptantibioticus rubrisoli]MCQ4042774.1 bacteriocin fulvocin C-related protein [Streptantibioticus rubrisoli]
MVRLSNRWVLAFDASCCQCRKVAERVKRSGGGRLDVMPLSHPDVQAWRAQALGKDAPPAPTLIQVGADQVRAWTGLAVAPRLAVRLGPRFTWRLLAALGELRGQTAERGESGGKGIGRGQFLRLAGVGAVAALLSGRATTAVARSMPPTAAEQWVQAHKGVLPRRYTDFAAHDLAHRKAIYTELPAPDRSRLWLEHLHRYRASHPSMSADQLHVVDQAERMAHQESAFAATMDTSLHRRLEGLRLAAIAAFGKTEGRMLLATLGGPAPSPESVNSSDCACSCISDWCDNGACVCCLDCSDCDCHCHGGCGTFWEYQCDGGCF